MNETAFSIPVPARSTSAVPVEDTPQAPEALALGPQIAEARQAWLLRSQSRDTRTNYARDLGHRTQRRGTRTASLLHRWPRWSKLVVCI
jgi:hypothetical protein